MKANTNRHFHPMPHHVLENIPVSTDDEKINLFRIALKMRKAGLSNHFIIAAVRDALEHEGMCDLMELWESESNKKERDEIIADIQDLLDDASQHGVVVKEYIRFNDLDSIAKNIRVFKDSLLTKVMELGGISKLSQLTGIPQPSLSRFFNTNTMPRRATLLKIAKALNMDELKMEGMWSK